MIFYLRFLKHCLLLLGQLSEGGKPLGSVIPQCAFLVSRFISMTLNTCTYKVCLTLVQSVCYKIDTILQYKNSEEAEAAPLHH
jgi:hypothetical protein